MRVAVYGGSFFPPHVGHAMVAAWLKWTDRADAVWLLPTYQHPFGKALAPFEDRLRWCAALAAAVGPWVAVSDIERTLGGTSYTVRTLDALAAAHPEHTFRLVIGADLLDATQRWHDWDRLAATYTPVVVGRAGWPDVPGSPTFPDVSSTMIRARLLADQDVSAWVPAAVLDAMADRDPTA